MLAFENIENFVFLMTSSSIILSPITLDRLLFLYDLRKLFAQEIICFRTVYNMLYFEDIENFVFLMTSTLIL